VGSDAANVAPATAQTSPQAPGSRIKYGSQVAADLRETLEKEFGDTETVTDLVKRALEYKGKLGRSLLIPTKDSPPEERKDFLEKMGIPPDGKYQYKLDKFKDIPGVEEFAAKYIERVAKPELMTPKQALEGLGFFLADIKGGFDRMAAERKQAEEQFEGKINELVNGDKAKAQEIMNRYKEFITHQIGDQPEGKEIYSELKRAGLLTNPKLAKVFAALHQRTSDMAFHAGAPDRSKPEPEKKPGSMGNYSSAWVAAHGGK
jgi:predicted TIM-barrel fold metal-dependent hydrolase